METYVVSVVELVQEVSNQFYVKVCYTNQNSGECSETGDENSTDLEDDKAEEIVDEQHVDESEKVKTLLKTMIM